MSSDVRTLQTGARSRSPRLSFADMGSSLRRFFDFVVADRVAHWFLRIPLAVLIWGYGVEKFPAVFINPGDFGVPAVLFVLNAFGEVLGVVALLAAGLVESWRPQHRLAQLAGDLLTRVGAFAIAASIAGVMVYFQWGMITLNSPHVMYLGLALYLLFRGNNLRAVRSKAAVAA